MHGISPQQFAETVSSFLVPFYIALAAMNGIAAFYHVAEDRAGDVFSAFRCRGFTVPFTNALLWTIVALRVRDSGVDVAPGRTSSLMPRMPLAFRDVGESRARAR